MSDYSEDEVGLQHTQSLQALLSPTQSVRPSTRQGRSLLESQDMLSVLDLDQDSKSRHRIYLWRRVWRLCVCGCGRVVFFKTAQTRI